MKYSSILLAVFLLFGVANSIDAQQSAPDTSIPYDLVSGWLKPVAKGRVIHPVTVFADSENRVFVGGSVGGDDPKISGATMGRQVFVVDQEGKVVEEWSKWSDRFGRISKITMNPYDSDKHVWVIDDATQQVMEFSHDGKDLISTLGEKGKAASDDKHFDGPTDICWLPDGTFFVLDGLGSERIVKFDKNRKYVTTWGRKGSGPGEFDHPQSIAVDARRHVWVADRGNGRVQIFDENGKFLDQWADFKEPQKIEITQEDAVWIWDTATARFADYDMKGKLNTYWTVDAKVERPKSNATVAEQARSSDFSVDPQGNLYLVNPKSRTVDKLLPKNDADKNRLVGQPYFLDIATTTY